MMLMMIVMVIMIMMMIMTIIIVQYHYQGKSEVDVRLENFATTQMPSVKKRLCQCNDGFKINGPNLTCSKYRYHLLHVQQQDIRVVPVNITLDFLFTPTPT